MASAWHSWRTVSAGNSLLSGRQVIPKLYAPVTSANLQMTLISMYAVALSALAVTLQFQSSLFHLAVS